MSMYDDNSQRLPIAKSVTRLASAKTQDGIQALGKGLPCTVAAVISPGIVLVNFEVASTPAPLPQITMPVGKPPYIQYPIQVGDIGVALSADLRLGGLTGLGGGTPNLQDTVGNLAAMTFFWLGSTSEEFINQSAVTLLEPTGNCNLQVAPTGVLIEGENGNLEVSGTVTVGNGASGYFTTPTGQTVTVSNGIVTGIY